jgi:phage-related protein
MANVVEIDVRANDQTKGFAGVKAGLSQALGGLAGIAKVAGADLAASLAGPVVAAAGTAVAAFASAGAALGAFGAAAKPQLAGVTAAADLYAKAQASAAAGSASAAKDMEAYKASLDKLPPATRATAVAFIGLKNDFQKWSDSLAPKTMPIFTQGINILRTLLPSLTPLVNAASTALSGFMGTLQKDAQGGGIQRFIGNLANAAKDVLPAFLNSLRNIAIGFGGVINAFLPFSGALAGGLEKLTAKFADFGKNLGTNSSFIQFMDNAKAKGPGLLELIGNLAKSFLAIATALAPFSGLTLIVAEAFAKLIAAIPQDVMNWLAPAIGGIVLAIRAWAVVQGILNVVLAANPIGLVVLAIAGLVAGLIYAYKHSETFRNIVNKAWSSIKEGVSSAWAIIKPIAKDFAEFFEKGIVPGIEKAIEKFTDLGVAVGAIKDKFSDLTSGLSAGGKGPSKKEAKGIGSKIIDIVIPEIHGGGAIAGLQKITDAFKKLDWEKAVSIHVKAVSKAFSTLKSAVSSATNYVSSHWRGFYDRQINMASAAMHSLASTFLGGIRKVVSFFLSPWPGAQAKFNGFMHGLTASVQRMISSVAGTLHRLPGIVAGIASHAWNALSSQLSRVAGAVRRIAGSMWNAIPASLRGAVNAVYGILSGLSGYVGSVLSNIASRISSVVHSIPGFAHGGIVGAAGGGPRSNLVMVGEQGRELVRLPFGSTVLPNGQTEGMMAAGGGSGGRTVIEINSSGSRLDDTLVEILRNAVRVRGGNVQVVLGR